MPCSLFEIMAEGIAQAMRLEGMVGNGRASRPSECSPCRRPVPRPNPTVNLRSTEMVGSSLADRAPLFQRHEPAKRVSLRLLRYGSGVTAMRSRPVSVARGEDHQTNADRGRPIRRAGWAPRLDLHGPAARRRGACANRAVPDVPDTTANNVWVVDTSTTAVSSIPTASASFYPAVRGDESRLYVSNYLDNTVTPINTATNTACTPFRSASPYGVAMTPDGTTVYVANNSGSTVTVINTATNVVTTIIAGFSSPTDVVVAPDGRTAYVTEQTIDKVTPIYIVAIQRVLRSRWARSVFPGRESGRQNRGCGQFGLRHGFRHQHVKSRMRVCEVEALRPAPARTR